MRLLFYISFLLFVTVFQTDSSFETVINLIEKDIVSYDSNKALHKIDSVLVIDYKTLTNRQKNTLNTLKVEALTKANLFDASLELSITLLKEEELTQQQKVRILINNALAYEYVGKFDVCREKLDEIKKIYEEEKLEKDHLFAQYLYRTSSFYRVQRKYDSLAQEYAEKAKEFSIVNNYKNEGAVASMLLGFLEFNKRPKLAEEHFKIGLQFWKDVDDTHGMASMYISLSRMKLKQKDYNLALKYCDSSIVVETGTKRYEALANSYFLKSSIYEKKGQLNKAIANLKTSQEYTHKSDLKNQDLKVNQLQFNLDYQKAKLDNETILRELKEEENRTKWLFFAIIALLIFSSIFMILSYRIKRKNTKINEQQRALNTTIEQKEILLKELHHRVKNNLSMILSLIKLQSNKLKNNDDKELLKNLEKRIETIAITHNQFLYKEDNAKYSLQEYLDKVIYKLVNLNPNTITINATIQNIEVSIDTALPIGIIVNELITNSLKHAKVDNELALNLALKKQNNNIVFSYNDNGKPTQELSEKDSLGLFLIDNMVKQLSGTYQKNKFHYKFDLKIKDE